MIKTLRSANTSFINKMCGFSDIRWILRLLFWILTCSSLVTPMPMPQQPFKLVPRRKEGNIPLHIIEDDIKVMEVDPYLNKDIWLRSAVADKTKVWTNGIIPYFIDATFFSSTELDTIQAAIEEFHNKTCVRFVPRKNQMPYLFITPLSRCWSEIGMPPDEGIRTLSLGAACLDRKGTVIHELMHVLGFWHEQNRADRDDYITVNWNNIKEGLQHNFYKYSEDKVDTLHEPYDYHSIMHYSAFAFAKDPHSSTIEPKIPVAIGQRIALSPMDVRKIHKLYRCSSSRPFLTSDQNEANPIIIMPSDTNPDVPEKIVFPDITELVPLPFKYNWTTKMTPNPSIVFPDH